MDNFKEKLNEVKAFVFDVDGVFSKATIALQPDGDLTRSMNTKDGYAVQFAVKKGYPVAVITGGRSEALKKRFNDLGITDVYLNSPDKCDDFDDFAMKYDIDPESVLFMGDDMPDYDVMQKVGIPVCPADAVIEIKAISLYISDKKGGEGCVRDIIEQVLRTQKNWTDHSKCRYKQ